jgi:hypothetical protein
MVTIDIHFWDTEMSCIDAISAINDEFMRAELLDVLGDFLRPGDRNIFVSEFGTTQLVTCLVGKDGGIVGIAHTGVRVAVS